MPSNVMVSDDLEPAVNSRGATATDIMPGPYPVRRLASVAELLRLPCSVARKKHELSRMREMSSMEMLRKPVI